jgi:thioredoxin-like negative regulator of GroEL
VSTVLSIVLQASIAATGATNTYPAAYQRTNETGRPLVVLVGADWCPACRTMKQTIIPQARQQGALDGVAFAVVDVDRQSALSRQLRTGSAIPELVVYHKTAAGWKRQTFVGAQSVSTIVSALKQAQQALARDASKSGDGHTS